MSIETSVKTGGIIICFPDPFDSAPNETPQFEINKNRFPFEIKNQK